MNIVSRVHGMARVLSQDGEAVQGMFVPVNATGGRPAVAVTREREADLYMA